MTEYEYDLETLPFTRGKFRIINIMRSLGSILRNTVFSLRQTKQGDLFVKFPSEELRVNNSLTIAR